MGTNLEEKYLEVICRRGVVPCVSPLAEGYAPGSLSTETTEISGTEFGIQGAGEGAAGSFYNWVGYSTARDDLCVSLTFVLHSVNPMNYTPPLPEFDSALEVAVFEEIVSTLVWMSP
jgi:hypothetical protein